MIYQFKKYLLTLIFTIALCYAMAVSASAVQYNLEDFSGSYNTASTSISFDAGDFPLERSFVVNASTSTSADTVSTQSTLYFPSSFTVSSGDVLYFRYLFPSCNSNAVLSSERLQLYFNVFTNTALIFYYDDSSVSIISDGAAANISDLTLIYSDSQPIGYQFTATFVRSIDTFLLRTFFVNPNSEISGSLSYSSYDDFIVSTEPISVTPPSPVYDPQITASQYNLTATTMTSQINLSGLDPSATYRVQYSLKETDSGETVASGVSNQIGVVTDVENYTGYSRIIDLKPSTAYQIVWAVTGTSDDIIDYYDFNFTTLADGSGGGGSGEATLTDSLLLLILNKVSAILDTISGGESDGILASISEKLDALIDTLANPEEQELEDNFKDSLTEVNDNFFGDDAQGQAVTVSDVGNLADTQGTVKNIFQSEYIVSDFFGIFSDQSLFAWFSADTAMDLNPNAYGGATLADLDDPYNMQDYYDNLEKVRGKK